MAAPRPTEQPPSGDGRTRNARAQARHREKRKAYIAQLEETVSRLQAAMALSGEQGAALPPPEERVRELELENRRLREEIQDLKRRLAGRNPSTSLIGIGQSPRSASSEEFNDDSMSRSGMTITHSPTRYPLPSLDVSMKGKRKRESYEETPGPSRHSPVDTPSSSSVNISRPASQPQMAYLPPPTPTLQSPIGTLPSGSVPPPQYMPHGSRVPSYQSTSSGGSNIHVSYPVPLQQPRNVGMHQHHHHTGLSLQTNFARQPAPGYPHSAPVIGSGGHLGYAKREDDDHAYAPLLHNPNNPMSSVYAPSPTTSVPPMYHSSSSSPHTQTHHHSHWNPNTNPYASDRPPDERQHYNDQ